MIFTRKGLLANKKIEEIFILSLLIDQTCYPDELRRIDTRLRREQSNDVEDDDIFIKAKKISELNSLKESLKKKYENIRKQCITRQNALKKSFVWILFFYSLRLADYIFQGYTYPPPIRAILSSNHMAPGKIASIFPAIFPVRDAKWGDDITSLYGKKNWLESKKLYDAIFSEQVIDFNFLSTIKKISVQNPEIKNYRNEKNSQSFPGPSSEYIESPIDLNKHLIKNGAATFMVRAQGDSMNEYNIGDHAICIVDRSIRPSENDIVIATIGGEFMLGCLKLGPNGFMIKKKKEFSGLEQTYFIEEEENEIIGVVTNSITKHYF